jgi:hypothetical protein
LFTSATYPPPRRNFRRATSSPALPRGKMKENAHLLRTSIERQSTNNHYQPRLLSSVPKTSWSTLCPS